MKLELELTWLIGLFVTTLGSFVGLAKYLLVQHQKHQDEQHRQTQAQLEEGKRASDRDAAAIQAQLKNIHDTREKDAGEIQRLERDWLTFKADLPIHYVRREDYVRGQTVIEAKLDALAGKLENNALRGMLGGKQ